MDKIKDEEGHGMVVGSRAHLVTSEAVVKVSLAASFGFLVLTTRGV